MLMREVEVVSYLWCDVGVARHRRQTKLLDGFIAGSHTAVGGGHNEADVNSLVCSALLVTH